MDGIHLYLHQLGAAALADSNCLTSLQSLAAWGACASNPMTFINPCETRYNKHLGWHTVKYKENSRRKPKWKLLKNN